MTMPRKKRGAGIIARYHAYTQERNMSYETHEKMNFIVNPASHSGQGLKIWKRVEALLKELALPYEVFFSEKSGDFQRITVGLTERLGEDEELFLVILGGDGSINEAVQGISNFEKVRFGYIPTGSSNDLARDMGLFRSEREALLALADGGREIAMDVGCLSWKAGDVTMHRRFLVSCGIGYDAAVCAGVQSSSVKAVLNRFGLGKLTYLLVGIRQMLAVRYNRAVLRLDGGEKIPMNRMLFAAVMSHRYEGGGFCFCPDADAQDGMLDLCVVDGLPKWKFPAAIPMALKGRHGMFKGVRFYRASKVEIRTQRPLWVHTDGEVPAGEMDRMTVTVLKQKLRFVF